MLFVLLLTFFVALAFDFVNGFHDAANSIATVVSTRVLRPGQAVAWAAFFNFIAAFTFGVKVAKTVGSGVVDQNIVTVYVILAGLIGAIIWNLLTWWWGLPSSSSHALIGGYAGAAFAKAGWSALFASKILWIASFIVIAPVVGAVLALINQTIVMWLVQGKSPMKMNQLFRKLQLVSAAIYSFSHGTNDAQKTMGILFALLVAGRQVLIDAHLPNWMNFLVLSDAFIATKSIPIWIIFLCYAMISAGTMAGGFRIVRTMGMKLTKLDAMHGFCAETGGGVTILAVSEMGIPVSTTHTITGAIVGVGMTGGKRAVRWLTAGRIIWAWIFTIPVSALIGFLMYLVLRSYE